MKLADIEVDRQTQLMQRNVAAQAKLDLATAKQGEARGAMLARKSHAGKSGAAARLYRHHIARSPAASAARPCRSGISSGRRADALATIVSQDPIYASFPVSQREMLAVRNEQAASKADRVVDLSPACRRQPLPKSRQNRLPRQYGEPGNRYGHVRAMFPNADGVLVEGQLVTVVVEAG